MALSNEEKREIRKMIETDRSDIRSIVQKQIREEIPKLFGRSMEQLRSFFISQIN